MTTVLSERATGDEDSLVAWLKRRHGKRIGDDAAALGPLRDAVVSVDAQHAGVHFPCDLDPAIAARRLLAVNLSDLAAMGAEPRYVLLSLAAPAAFPRRRFLEALAAAADRHDVELVGGDLSNVERASFVLTVIGVRPPRGRLLERSAARPGARIWVGGSLGEAAVGLELVTRGARIQGRRVVIPEALVPGELLREARSAVRRQLQPTPQLELGEWLGRRRFPVAAIDVSDGLGRDLARVCKASGVGARLDGEALPFASGHRRLCRLLGEDPLRLAAGGGEDYVLAFTLPAGQRPPARFACTAIGEVVAERGVELELPGRSLDIRELGWDHLAPPAAGR